MVPGAELAVVPVLVPEVVATLLAMALPAGVASDSPIGNGGLVGRGPALAGSNGVVGPTGVPGGGGTLGPGVGGARCICSLCWNASLNGLLSCNKIRFPCK